MKLEKSRLITLLSATTVILAAIGLAVVRFEVPVVVRRALLC